MRIILDLTVTTEADELDEREVVKDLQLYVLDFANAVAMGTTANDIQGGFYVVRASALEA